MAAWPLAARAQQPGKIFRIGFLGFGSAANWANRVEALRGGLRDLGYVDGKNIVIEFRWTETIEQLPELATELARMNVDVIFAPSSTEVEVARQVTNAIPIVFATHADPVGLGHVASLSRPGGNITGLSGLGADLAVKALEILKEAVPNATRYAVFWTPQRRGTPLSCKPRKVPVTSSVFNCIRRRCNPSRIWAQRSRWRRKSTSTLFLSNPRRSVALSAPLWPSWH
jgi:putative ABC transport system substrate-binding protein